MTILICLKKSLHFSCVNKHIYPIIYPWSSSTISEIQRLVCTACTDKVENIQISKNVIVVLPIRTNTCSISSLRDI